MNKHKYNKGEWSELYAFLFALDKGKIYAANEDMQQIPNVFYEILSAFNKDTEYTRGNINIIFQSDKIRYKVPILDIHNKLKCLFRKIKNGKKTFEIPEIEPLLQCLKITTLKAGSNSKGDLKLKIHDAYTGINPTLNFSVKSYIGGRATLLNASSATTVKYHLTKNISNSDIQRINNFRGKIVDKITAINKCSVNPELEFENFNSDIFQYNLQMIDYKFPKILAELFLESYFVKGKKIPAVIKSFIKKHPDEKESLIEYKVRQFLIACALGMFPDTSWAGIDEATGGYIVVKDNADVLCYHIYNRNKLSDYLFYHTSFDTPSTSRYDLGKIKSDSSNKQFFELNTQIRFF